MRISDWQMLLSIVVTTSFRKIRSSLMMGSMKIDFSYLILCIILGLLEMLAGIDSYQL